MIKKLIFLLIVLILPVVSAELEGFGNQPPTIESIDNQYLIVGEPYSLTVNAVDAEGEILTFSDNTELFDINSRTGEINFVPKETDIGRYAVIFSVSDGTKSSLATAYFTIASRQAGRFELDKSMIKTMASQDESKKEQLTIYNNANYESVYTLELQGLGIAHLSEEYIQIPAQGSEIIEINFKGTEPGIYSSKLIVRSGDQIETLPIVFEVESAEVSIDGKLSLQDDEFKAEDEVIFSITLMDLSGGGIKKVRVYRYIYDLLGSEVYETHEDISIESQATFTKTLRLPSYLRPGEYVAAIKIVSGESVGTSSQVFSIIEEAKAPSIPVFLYLVLIVIAAVAILIIYRNRLDLLKVKKLRVRRLKIEPVDRLIQKRKEYLSHLSALSNAFELKAVSRENYLNAKKKLDAELKKLKEVIKKRMKKHKK